MGLTLNGVPIQATPVTPASPVVDRETPDRVVLFMRLVALNCEARRDLAEAVRRRRTLEAKLADPANADHPGRPAAERKLARRHGEEHHATVRLMETNVSLERQWHQIPVPDKHRYGLTFVIGEPDPEANILGVLWCGDRGLGLLVPFPDDWTPPHDIAHKAFDTTVELSTVTREELLHAEYPDF